MIKDEYKLLQTNLRRHKRSLPVLSVSGVEDDDDVCDDFVTDLKSETPTCYINIEG